MMFIFGVLAGWLIVFICVVVAIYRAAKKINESEKNGRTRTLASQFSMARHAAKRSGRNYRIDTNPS